MAQPHGSGTEELQREKLELEIAALRRPFHRTPAFWFGFSTAVVALLGAIAQSFLSKLDRQQAQLDRDRAIFAKDQTEQELNRLAAKRAESAAELDSLRKALDEVRAARREVDDRLWSLIDAASNLPAASKSGEFSAATSAAARALLHVSVRDGVEGKEQEVRSVLGKLGYGSIEYFRTSRPPQFRTSKMEDVKGVVVEHCSRVHVARALEIARAVASLHRALPLRTELTSASLCQSEGSLVVRVWIADA